MVWYIPAILIPTLLVSVYLSGRALNEIEKGFDRFKVIAPGLLAGDEHFTPRGRRYRLQSLAVLGGGVLLVILVYLVTSIQ